MSRWLCSLMARYRGYFALIVEYRLIKHCQIALMMLYISLKGSFQTHRKAGKRESKVSEAQR